MAYRSQTEYGPYGLRICTPVSLLVCSHFVRRKPQAVTTVRALFPPERIDDYMCAAHKLYERRFASLGHPAPLAALLGANRTVPNSEEWAGTVAEGCETVRADDLSIASLPDLLHHCKSADGDRALLVTVGGHSTAYLFESATQRVHRFDPLPASLVDVTAHLAAGLSAPAGAEYNALLLSPPDV